MTADDVAKSLSSAERQKTMKLCLGRIFRLGSHPEQPGDVPEYRRCRDLFVACAEAEGMAHP